MMRSQVFGGPSRYLAQVVSEGEGYADYDNPESQMVSQQARIDQHTRETAPYSQRPERPLRTSSRWYREGPNSDIANYRPGTRGGFQGYSAGVGYDRHPMSTTGGSVDPRLGRMPARTVSRYYREGPNSDVPVAHTTGGEADEGGYVRGGFPIATAAAIPTAAAIAKYAPILAPMFSHLAGKLISRFKRGKGTSGGALQQFHQSFGGALKRHEEEFAGEIDRGDHKNLQQLMKSYMRKVSKPFGADNAQHAHKAMRKHLMGAGLIDAKAYREISGRDKKGIKSKRSKAVRKRNIMANSAEKLLHGHIAAPIAYRHLKRAYGKGVGDAELREALTKEMEGDPAFEEPVQYKHFTEGGGMFSTIAQKVRALINKAKANPALRAAGETLLSAGKKGLSTAIGKLGETAAEKIAGLDKIKALEDYTGLSSRDLMGKLTSSAREAVDPGSSGGMTARGAGAAGDQLAPWKPEPTTPASGGVCDPSKKKLNRE